jgi:SAM-dependent methyltransferase
VKPSEYYDSKYYAWQKSLGEFGGTAELIKFQPHIERSDNVIDFGCGGGFLLANLKCKGKLGIEVNPAARETCGALGIEAVEAVDQLPEEWADKIISNHALEHVTNPFETLVLLRSKLKAEGRAIFVVPCESVETKYVKEDINQHLYTWSPINIGNLFKSAGYDVVECKPFFHRWPPMSMILQKLLGWRLFHASCRVYGFFFRRLSQVRIVALKR